MLKREGSKRLLGVTSLALISSLSLLVLVSCGDNNPVTVESKETSTAPVEGFGEAEGEPKVVAGEVKGSDEVLAQRLTETIALREETSKSLQESSQKLASKQKLYSELEARLSQLEEGDDVDSVKTVVAATKTDSELQLLNRDLTVTQQNIRAGFLELRDEIVEASQALTNPEAELKRLREFGKANVGREFLYYLFTLKFLWGIFIGYRVSSYTYQPELAQELLDKLANVRVSINEAAAALAAGIVKPKSTETRDDLKRLNELVEGSLKALEENQQALSTRAVTLPLALLPKLKALLDLAINLPEDQAKIEKAKEKLESLTAASKAQTKDRKDLEIDVKQTSEEIKGLIEEVRVGKAKVEQLDREIEALQAKL